ncbi:hypothetical protein PMI14_06666 [Acidovorax sp. CF316]|uniref:hypothetical protein n=1 Tax=Acidovorax sp. CF316 TaxID=1144317 RepID=UPI00026BD868|nr:hypothetical protein [Acidovorax sp. CF316]EJE48903.1 hypothetical protein PMI14_06666 [Acidovorax sp. CF316]
MLSTDDHPAPLPCLWATLAYVVGAQWVHWGWSRIASKSTGQEVFLLMLFSILAWPIAVVIASSILVAVFKRTPGAVRAAITLGLIALGLAVFGVPTLWNTAFTAGIGITAFIHFQREEQDDADLEKL